MIPTFRAATLFATVVATSLASAQAPAPVVIPASNESVQRFHDIATMITRQANLKPGQVVVISGSAGYLPFMEDVAIQATQAGAATIMDVQTDRLQAAARQQSGGRYGYSPPTALEKDLMTKADLWIIFPNVSGPGALPTLSAEQQRAVDSSVAAWRPSINRRHSLFVNIPLERDTAGTGMTYAELSRRRWNAMQADYSHISAVGESLRSALASGKTVRVTSPEGTDVTFSLAPNGVMVDAIPSLGSGRYSRPANRAFVPGGSVTGIVVESSANGKVRAAHDQCTLPVSDEAIDVNRGRAENVHAGSDEACVQKSLKGLRLSAISIGLNPALTDIRTPVGMPLETAGEGLVSIYFGDNRFFGGSNNDGLNWYVPLTKATVSVDGRTIVRDGQIVDRR
jgi:leucyl aminopeptidase (aminopeptidase T)